MPATYSSTCQLGTPIVWGQPSASGVTKNLTLDALASTKARMGVYADLGSSWQRTYLVVFQVETGTAPTAGLTADLYLACTPDTSIGWPGGVDGTDDVYKNGEELEWLKQIGRPVVQLKATNDGNTVQTQQPVLWTPKGRYVAPVVYDGLGVAFRDEATDTNNGSRVYLYPILDMAAPV